MQNIDGSTSGVLSQETPRGRREDNIYEKSGMKTDTELPYYLEYKSSSFSKYCFLEERGDIIFGSLKINVKNMNIKSDNC